MKNKFLSFILAICLVLPALLMTACGGSEHEHSYTDGICSSCGAIEGVVINYDSDTQTYVVMDGKQATLTNIVIPSSYNDGKNGEHPVASIFEGAFFESTGLVSITLPDSVKSIGSHAFGNCRALQTVNLGNGLNKICQFAFGGSTLLSSITIPSSVNVIEDGAFSSCEGLNSITLPNAVTVVNANMFNGCTSLQTVVLGNSVTKIYGWAFRGCEDLTTINIPSTVDTIGQYAFSTCTSLASLTIPASVTTIGFFAFADAQLQTIYYQGTEAQWDSIEKGKFGKVHQDYEDDIALSSQTIINYAN
ncbi:MAG: leucine-rich repeat domain-containing protein [Clostridiales bacterium]|nr:leucine-rich repeat domain-containing protein [Clostridiales bacterium]